MRIIVFDTETTGLPINFNAPSEFVDNWPNIVQLSWQIWQNNKLESEKDFIIKLDDIPENSTKIHGITTFISQQEGVDIRTALNLFYLMYENCDLVVGHNIYFDLKVIQAEYIRNLDYKLPMQPKYCTMMHSTKLLKLLQKNGRGYKFPKLEELYKYLFGENMDNAHNSLYDVRATSKCYFELKNRGL